EKVDKWRVEKLRGGGQQSIAIYRPEAYGKYMGPHEVEAFVLAEALETRARAIVEAHGARNTEVTHSRQQRAEVADARDFDSKDGGAFTRRSDSNRRRLGSSHEPPPPKPPSEDGVDDFADSPTTASGSSDEPLDLRQLSSRQDTVVVRRARESGVAGEHSAPQDAQGDPRRDVREDSSPSPSAATSGDPAISPGRAAEPPAKTAEASEWEGSASSSDGSIDLRELRRDVGTPEDLAAIDEWNAPEGGGYGRPLTPEDLVAIDEWNALEGNGHARPYTPEEPAAIDEWAVEAKTKVDKEIRRPPIEGAYRAERAQAATHDAGPRLVHGQVDVVPAGPHGGSRLNIEGREYDFVASDGDAVYARVAGGREAPLGDAMPV